jgi:prepilin-type N-terminal cleavage/methylation domain-containing protein/prepilin-type processing-associated H-X9-DG protein
MNSIVATRKSCTPAAEGRSGFTLLEILLVVAIIALLVSILLPSLTRAREQAKRTQCATNQKQMLTGIHMYTTAYRGQLPGSIKAFNQSLTWLVWQNFGKSPNPPRGYVHHGLLYGSRILKDPKVFFCPSYTEYPHVYPEGWTKFVAPNGAEAVATSYMYSLNGQVNMYPKGVRIAARLEDLGVREALHSCVFMAKPDKYQRRGVWPHQGGINVALADGSIQLMHVESDLARTAAKLYDSNNTTLMDYFSFCFFKMLSGDRHFMNAYPAIPP